MIKRLHLKHVGPAPSMELDFAPRLNILTGDNGLGKSFLLDIVWWVLTRTWPAEINAELSQTGHMALPRSNKETAKLSWDFEGKSKPESKESSFDAKNQAWKRHKGRPSMPGIVIYAMPDGSFGAWDPARNYWTKDKEESYSAFVFTPAEVWNGLYDDKGTPLCNGLIRDWASWQKENGPVFDRLKAVLTRLSPPDTDSHMQPGKLTRISLRDARDMPTISMPYGQEVPVAHASSGIRRILALAYLLVWVWEEHLKACELKGTEPARQITFLIDEVEAHLHPRWQLTILQALLSVTHLLQQEVSVQLMATTHAPLVLTSLESWFDNQQDAWFDLDFQPHNMPQVQIHKRDFQPQGDANRWLTSDAFDLPTARNPQTETLLKKAAALWDTDEVESATVESLHRDLIEHLPATDPFLFRWRAIAERKGLLEL